MLCESQTVWDQGTFSVSQVHGEGAPCYVDHRLFGTSGHSVYPRYMGRGLHVMGITDCLGPVDIQCIPGTWGGAQAPCYVNHRLFGTSGHSVYPRYMGMGLHVMGITDCLGPVDIQCIPGTCGGAQAPCYVNHRLFGTSGHSVYPRYMGRGLHVMGITGCLGPVDIQCIPGTWGGGSMLCESQAVWDQWTFSVSQVHGGGGGSMLWESQAVWDQWTFSVSQVHGEGAPC